MPLGLEFRHLQSMHRRHGDAGRQALDLGLRIDALHRQPRPVFHQQVRRQRHEIRQLGKGPRGHRFEANRWMLLFDPPGVNGNVPEPQLNGRLLQKRRLLGVAVE